ncbi:MAG: hypothetical protein ABIN94_10415 [Ferruginibacter sp.]
MKKFWQITFAAIMLLGCSGDNVDTKLEPTQPKIDSFFPVTSFIKGQMNLFDSLQVTPLQITVIKEKNDSVWLKKLQLKQTLQSFLTPEINETGLTKYFKQTKFHDQTLNAITFTYDPVGKLPDSLPLRHWDVYIDPETGNVMKVYIVKGMSRQGRSYTEQLTWQTGQSAKISSFLNKPDGSMELIKDMIVKWDF